jgi:hypothetical protein
VRFVRERGLRFAGKRRFEIDGVELWLLAVPAEEGAERRVPAS